ncbi:2-amino-4-hydroxy-6-hydroxymethyldihydropteridine diphosphokinase [Paucibacter sp. KBW04]|uniref:2-amino-4-hydroxy-6- hydroxymethyldihydropteridine diphosphokinase n=1 Tax=Paucibacter sp. KBW04 TaxID=2153361 RepID=UPI000F58EF0A|nr:2-amino-4-hydroxy-6-hydroxymethyldihydropteridine diphosphokinase [Paucibacter sp. KBW04]RQO62029.1 2-amino-4-hydroxy-6-hydroxymethyldihydropteridine diphosphokinase [Paucibacter sp. KBW04]
MRADSVVGGTLAFVGLGANLGDTRQSLQQALQALSELPSTALLACSSAYRTAPVEASGPDFLNAVAMLRTQLSPMELLDALQAIEQAHGRERPYLNAPRTLDLDLLLFGELSLASMRLTLPHPRLHQRAFVLQPLLELQADLAAPGLGALAAFLPALQDQAISRLGPLWPQG